MARLIAPDRGSLQGGQGTAPLQPALPVEIGPEREGRLTVTAYPRRGPDPTGAGTVHETDIPARLDRLPWGRFHTLVVVALGITWILDGLEVTLAGSVAG